MKKQLMIMVIASLLTIDAFALSPGQMRIAKENPFTNVAGQMWNGSAFVPYVAGGGSGQQTKPVNAGGGGGGNPNQAAADALAACDQAVQKLQAMSGLSGGNPNSLAGQAATQAIFG